MKRKIENFLKELTAITNKTGIVIDTTNDFGLVNDSGWIVIIWYDYQTQSYTYRLEK